MKYLNVKNGFRRSFLIAGIICCCAFYAKSQAPVKQKAVKQTAVKPAGVKPPALAKLPVAKSVMMIIDTFFKKYKDDGTSPAIDFLFGTNKLFTDTAQVALLKGKLDALRQSIGKYLGKEMIAQRSASPSLFFYSYLVKHENQPVRFTFMFYKPQNDWVLYRFKYDDQLDAELEEAGKINNKRP
jgi:hypothetical protein